MSVANNMQKALLYSVSYKKSGKHNILNQICSQIILFAKSIIYHKTYIYYILKIDKP